MGPRRNAPGSIARRAASQAVARQAARDAVVDASRSRLVRATLARRLPGTLRMTRPEMKSCDVVSASVAVSTTAQFILLNGVQEGSSFYNRIGRRISMRSLHLKFTLAPSGNGAGVGETLRFMVIYDRQPNGAAPAISDLLLDYDNTGATGTTVKSGMNMNNSDRFVMLRDKILQIPNNGAAVALSAGQEAIMDQFEEKGDFNWFVKLRGSEVHYKATSNPAVIGDIATGALYFVTYSNIAVATSGYNATYLARLRYSDL